MSQELDVGHSIFEGYNDSRGIMICGYEWGFDSNDQRATLEGREVAPDYSADSTFSYKAPRYGDAARTWPFDRRVIKWFELWGHPLDTSRVRTGFDKSLVQTNWCSSQARRMSGSIVSKLLEPKNAENFLRHAEKLRPSVILFMGTRLIDALNNKAILPKFETILGLKIGSVRDAKKSWEGRRFRIRFQSFENCEVVCLPHPSGTRGLSDGYIKLFKDEIGPRLSSTKFADLQS